MSERAYRSSKAPDAAVALPLFGLFLLMPPVISLFAAPASLFGVPLIVLYLFGVWAILIACAALLTRHLGRGPAMPDAIPDTAAPADAAAGSDASDASNQPV